MSSFGMVRNDAIFLNLNLNKKDNMKQNNDKNTFRFSNFPP